ncbi:hypothetical protein [Microbacterium oxydans]|nr:hypothetical protein [Microbacterium oxydans]MCZ4300759.1 hypothetical protein [Microbacterium oxydans]
MPRSQRETVADPTPMSGAIARVVNPAMRRVSMSRPATVVVFE